MTTTTTRLSTWLLDLNTVIFLFASIITSLSHSLKIPHPNKQNTEEEYVPPFEFDLEKLARPVYEPYVSKDLLARIFSTKPDHPEFIPEETSPLRIPDGTRQRALTFLTSHVFK